MLPPPKFHSSRLVYRAVSHSDRPWLLALLRQPDVQLKASAGVCTPRNAVDVDGAGANRTWEMMEGLLLSVIVCLPAGESHPSTEEPGERIAWIFLRAEGESQHRLAEFGLFTAAEGRGLGYGTEFLRWLLFQAFHRFGLHKVQGSVFAWNDVALRCYTTKCGFREEARRREQYWQEGAWRDEILVGITELEWRAQQKEQEREGEKAAGGGVEYRPSASNARPSESHSSSNNNRAASPTPKLPMPIPTTTTMPTPSFHSSRLVYRAPALSSSSSSSDQQFLISLMRSPDAMLRSNGSATRPVSSDPGEKWNRELLGLMEGNLLCVLICLPSPSPPSSSTIPTPEAGEPIGQMSLWSEMPPAVGAQHRRAEFGINLLPSAQGKGYGPEALSWLLYQSFQRFGLHKVTGQCFSFNEPALKCYKKVGFTEEGRLRDHCWREGGWGDDVVIGILEDEWRDAYALKGEQGQ